MGQHPPIEIDIQWRCPHCGHPYGQPLAVCVPGTSGEGQLVGAGSMICPHCGQLGPMQVGCAIVIGMSVMAGSDGALHAPRPVEHAADATRWASRVKSLSRN